MYYTITAVLGLMNGIVYGNVLPILTDFGEPQHLVILLGMNFLGEGVGALTMPSLAGEIHIQRLMFEYDSLSI